MTMTTTGIARNTVMAFLKHLNAEEFEEARLCADDHLRFEGVLGRSREGYEAYFRDMERLKIKFHVLKTFADGDDVCVLYNVTFSGVTMYSCGWYKVEYNKISAIRVVYDPRPLLVHMVKKDGS
jgi:predicted SnoaL-like aldol condensation-catalyzing enzyme